MPPLALTPGSGHVEPLLKILVYDAGQADPVVTDRGYVFHDILANSYLLGQSSLGSGGFPDLIFYPEIGLTNHVELRAKDTLALDWTLSPNAGSWSQWRPDTGRYRTFRLVMYNTGNDLFDFSATSRTFLPPNPSFVVSLWTSDTPADYPSDTHEPAVQIEFGAAHCRFSVRLEKNGRYLLLKWDPALNDWAWARDLTCPPKGRGVGDNDELFIWFRCLRGKIGVSAGGGVYEWFGKPGQYDVPSGKVTVRGRGVEVGFGLHDLVPTEGVWRSPPQPTLTSSLFGSALITGRYDQPPGTDVQFADVSDTVAALAQYEALLTPASDGSCPVLYSTTLRYLANFDVPTLDTTEPWTGEAPTNGRAVGARISGPPDLKGATCSIRIKLNPGDVPLSALRRRKIEVWRKLRIYTDEEAFTDTDWVQRFTGYVRHKRTSQSAYGDGWQTLELGAMDHWTRPEWWPTDILPLGGMVLNDALDYVLGTEGVEGANLPNYRGWHILGDLFRLDPGLAEEPFELLRPGERKAATMDRIVGYAGMELGIDNEGKLFTLVKCPSGVPATTGVSHDYHASGNNDLLQLAEDVEQEVDYDQSSTAVYMSGRSQVDGGAMVTYAVDLTAEQDRSSDRFCPWREGGPDGQEEVQDPCSIGMLAFRTAAKAYDLFPIKWEPNVGAYLNPDMSRRDEILLYGCEDQDVPDGTRHVVVALEEDFQVPLDGGPNTLKIEMGLFRMPGEV